MSFIIFKDVDGSKPRKLYMWNTRDGFLKNMDIPGSSPKQAKVRLISNLKDKKGKL